MVEITSSGFGLIANVFITQKSAPRTTLFFPLTKPGTKVPKNITRSDKNMTLFVTLGLMGDSPKNLLPGVDLQTLNSKNRKKK